MMTLDEWTDTQGELREDVEAPLEFVVMSEEDKRFISRMIRITIRHRYSKEKRI